jgi:hypothetical protein
VPCGIAAPGAFGGDVSYWTAKGKRLVYERGYRVGLMDVNGQHRREFAGDFERTAISPSGRLLARFIDMAGPRRRLVLKTLEGRRVRTFTVRAHPGDTIVNPTWAPDESAVAFINDRVGIFVADRRKGVRLLIRGDFDYYGVTPAWSPYSARSSSSPARGARAAATTP